MKPQFSIAGVLYLTTLVATAAWLLTQPTTLAARLASAAFLSGSMVGLIVGCCYRRVWQGMTWGVMGALAACVLVVGYNFKYWLNAGVLDVVVLLLVASTIGAVPIASLAVVFQRPAPDLVIWPLINCLVAAAIPTVPAALAMMVQGILNRPELMSATFVAMVIAYFLVLLLVGLSLAAALSLACSAAAIILREMLVWLGGWSSRGLNQNEEA